MARGLAPRGALRRHRRKQRSVADSERQRYWKMTVTRGGCVMCHAEPVSVEVRKTYYVELADIQGHHILPQQALKRAHLEEFLWDERNGCGLCGYHHPRHTTYRERMPRALVPETAYKFAAELGVEWLIDGEYPL